jgi:ribonuclease G
VADWIYAEEGEMLEYIENRLKRRVVFKVEPTFHVEQYELE